MSRTLLVAVLILVWLRPALVPAHNVQVFAYVENGIIKGEGTLSGGRPAKNGVIKVISKVDQRLLLTTTTGDSGTFTITPEALGLEEPADLIILLDAGPGHRSQWQLSAADFSRSETTAAAQSGKSEKPTEKKSPFPASPPLRNVVTGIISIVGLGALIKWSRSRRRGKK